MTPWGRPRTCFIQNVIFGSLALNGTKSPANVFGVNWKKVSKK